MMSNEEINSFMSENEIYNKVILKMKVILFGFCSLETENFDILPFVLNNTPIIDNLNNKKVFQNLDNFDMLRFNDGIYFSDNIIRCFFCE